MKIPGDLKKFIIEHEDEIDSNDWEKIYDELDGTHEFFNGQLLDVMMEIELNPLIYLRKIPEYFASSSDMKSFTIPPNIISIGSYAFINCIHLTSITISSNILNIEGILFWGCDNLKDIKFEGTKKQWRDIKKSSSWRVGSKLERIICSDGEITLK